MSAPGYWMNETSGVLRLVVLRYLKRKPMQVGDVAVMRGYLRQWIAADLFRGPEIAALRETVDGIVDRLSLDAWIDRALLVGVDPL